MRRLILAAGGLVVVLLLIVAQIVLPRIAAQNLRDRLSQDGQVLSVSVHAFPAIELLWHHADTVSIRLGRYRTPPAKLGDSLQSLGGVGSLRATATVLDVGLLRLHEASLTKHGDRLSATATVSEADLRAAVPVLLSVTPVASSGGQLVLRGRAGAFGITVTVDAVLHAVGGALVLTPDVPLGGLGTITVFSHAHLRVDGVSASPASGGFTLHGTAIVH